MTKLTTPKAVVDALEGLYSEAVEALSGALDLYLHKGTAPDTKLRDSGAFCYPQIRLTYDPDGPPPPISRAFGKMSEAGTYISTFTRPDFFRAYLIEQLTPLMRDYDVEVVVERSGQEIPYAYVWEQGQAEGLEEISPAELARWFPSPKLATRLQMANCSSPMTPIRWPCSMPLASTSHSSASSTIPARRSSISSTMSCSPITTAMSMPSATGR